MNQSLIVRGAPQEYECGEGVWGKLEEHINRRKLTSLLVLHGETSWDVARPYFPVLKNTRVYFEEYGGRCTDKRVQEVVERVQKDAISGIVAVGGGTVSDLGKAAAHNCQCSVILLPTLAATCAAYTPLSVMYNQDGSMDRYDVFPISNALVLIEPKVLIVSPINLMIAGIGDTLAKWYEAEAMISQLDVQPVEIQIAKYAAKQCQERLLANSQQALTAMKNKKINQAFLDVVETNILPNFPINLDLMSF